MKENLLEIVKLLFGEPTDNFELIGNWLKWTIPNDSVNRFKLNFNLISNWKVYGKTDNGLRVIVTYDSFLLIKENIGEDIELYYRDNTRRFCYILPKLEEDKINLPEDVVPDFMHGYIREINIPKKMKDFDVKFFKHTTDERFKSYECDDKSWYFINSLLINNVDLIPTLRLTFEDWDYLFDSKRRFVNLPKGFIYFINDKDVNKLVICSYTNHISVNKIIDELISIENQNREESYRKLIDLLTQDNSEKYPELEVELVSCLQNKL